MRIRSYQSADADQVLEICFETALYGSPIGQLIRDRGLIEQALLRYYREREPDCFWVAEDQERIVGYLTGSRATGTQEHWYARHVLPGLASTLILRGYWASGWFWRALTALPAAWRVRKACKERLLPDFPAHCHINLKASVQRTGVGTQLYGMFEQQIRQAGIPGIHVASGTDAGQSFFRKMGFAKLAEYPGLPLPKSPEMVVMMGKKL